MASKASMEIAHYAFIAFVMIAIVAGLAFGAWAYSINNTYPVGFYDSTWSSWNSWILLIMLVLGIIVGLVSITTTEIQPFLTATIALIVASLAHVWDPLEKIHTLLPYWAVTILNYIVAFAAPAAVIIAIRGVIELARKK
jgi:uncharacterized membrane protein